MLHETGNATQVAGKARHKAAGELLRLPGAARTRADRAGQVRAPGQSAPPSVPPARRAATPFAVAQRQHQHLVALRQLALGQDYLHPTRSRLRQHLLRERRHHLMVVDKRVCEHPHDLVVTHVDALGRPGQRGNQLYRVGAVRVYHRCRQQGEVPALCLAPAPQLAPQFLRNALATSLTPPTPMLPIHQGMALATANTVRLLTFTKLTND